MQIGDKSTIHQLLDKTYMNKDEHHHCCYPGINWVTIEKLNNKTYERVDANPTHTSPLIMDREWGETRRQGKRLLYSWTMAIQLAANMLYSRCIAFFDTPHWSAGITRFTFHAYSSRTPLGMQVYIITATRYGRAQHIYSCLGRSCLVCRGVTSCLDKTSRLMNPIIIANKY